MTKPDCLKCPGLKVCLDAINSRPERQGRPITAEEYAALISYCPGPEEVPHGNPEV